MYHRWSSVMAPYSITKQLAAVFRSTYYNLHLFLEPNEVIGSNKSDHNIICVDISNQFLPISRSIFDLLKVYF